MANCNELAEKIFTRKASQTQEDIVRQVMQDIDIKQLRDLGYDDVKINQIVTDTLEAHTRKAKDLFASRQLFDNPIMQSVEARIMSIIDNSKKIGRGISKFEVEQIVRQTTNRYQSYLNGAYNSFLDIFNSVKMEDGDVPNPRSFFNLDRANNFKKFIQTGEAVGDSVERQIQLKWLETIKKYSKTLGVTEQSVIDSSIFSVSDLYLSYQKAYGNNNIPNIRSRFLGEGRYAFVKSYEDSLAFKKWFMDTFNEVFESPTKAEITWSEIFGTTRGAGDGTELMSRTATSNFRKFEAMRRKGIIDNKFMNKYLEVVSVTGEDIFQNSADKIVGAYSISRTYGNQPLQNIEKVKTNLAQTLTGMSDTYGKANIESTFKNFDGMLRFMMGDRTDLKPNMILDGSEILLGVFKMTKSAGMALRQVNDQVLRNVLFKQFSQKSWFETIGDNTKYMFRQAFGDDYDLLKIKDKEILLGIQSSMSESIFGNGDTLTSARMKRSGWIDKASEFTYRHLSFMDKYESFFERSGMLHTSSIIKDLQNMNYDDIIALDKNGVSTKAGLSRAIRDVGLTKAEFEVFKNIKFDTDYFSSGEMRTFLKNNKDLVKKLLYIDKDNLDYNAIERAIEARVTSQLPFKYDIETGRFDTGSINKLIDETQNWLERNGKGKLDLLDTAKENGWIKDIKYNNGELYFYYKDVGNMPDITDPLEKNLRSRFKQAVDERSRAYRVGEHLRLMSGNVEESDLVKYYNSYINNLDDAKLNRLINKKIDDYTFKFDDMRNNMTNDATTLKFDYWDRYIADKANGDTRYAVTNRLFGFYKSALYKSNERWLQVFRNYDYNGVLRTGNVFNRYAGADMAFTFAMAGLYGTLGAMVSGDILREDNTNPIANGFLDSVFIGGGLYLTAPAQTVIDFGKAFDSTVTGDVDATWSNTNRAFKRLMPSTVSNYGEALFNNY